MNENFIFNLLAFLFGTLFGSFSNVLIYRIPKGIDWKIKRSFCPSCEKKIKWFQNIPIVSYLFCRGKCSYCKKEIPISYFLIELTLGLLAVILLPKTFSLVTITKFILMVIVLTILMTHFFIDLKYHILPDGLNISLGLIFIILAVLDNRLTESLYGFLIGFFFPFLIALFFQKVRKKDGLGGGDIKLYGALGLFFGPYKIITLIFFSCFLGSLWGIAFILIKKLSREHHFAFGPAIILTALIQIFFPNLFSSIILELYGH